MSVFVRYINKPAEVEEAFTPYLESGEQIRHLGYSMQKPPLFAGIFLALVTTQYWHKVRRHLVALTDRRFIALKLEGGNSEITKMFAWALTALPPIKVSTTRGYIHILIEDPAQPFEARLYAKSLPRQYEEAKAIAAALTGGAPEA